MSRLATFFSAAFFHLLLVHLYLQSVVMLCPYLESVWIVTSISLGLGTIGRGLHLLEFHKRILERDDDACILTF